MDVQIDTATRVILAYGAFSAEPEGAGQSIVELAKEHVPALSEPGTKVLRADGSIAVTPPAPPDPTAIARDKAATAERSAAHADLHDGAKASLVRLDAVIANGGAYTAAEVRTAVVDMARVQKRLLRYLVASGA
ncbi:MAG TPA: hypothetical protein VNM48_02080 [Chloroflexota bacterium]|nr:hypothetical protein [Chloroflexota bacterium]